jgi:hypothetical protein
MGFSELFMSTGIFRTAHLGKTRNAYRDLKRRYSWEMATWRNTKEEMGI